MNCKELEIKINGTFAELWVNGEKITDVRSFRLEKDVGNSFAVLTLDLNQFRLSIDKGVILRQRGMGESQLEFLHNVKGSEEIADEAGRVKI